MNANTKINKASHALPAWMVQGTPVQAQRGPVQARGMDMVSLPRPVVLAGVVASLVGTLALGIVVGVIGAKAPTTAPVGTVSYVGPTNTNDDQHGPLRAPSGAEIKAYGMALETAYGTCSLEWHGTEGGWWEPVCQGPHSH